MRSDITPGSRFPDYQLPDRPHTIALEPGLVVYEIYKGCRFWGRPSVNELWRGLREVSREIRPDWDLSAPGRREAWDAGGLSPFHAWNRRISAPSSADGAVR
jgi:hypothetical protein